MLFIFQKEEELGFPSTWDVSCVRKELLIVISNFQVTVIASKTDKVGNPQKASRNPCYLVIRINNNKLANVQVELGLREQSSFNLVEHPTIYCYLHEVVQLGFNCIICKFKQYVCFPPI